MYRFAFEVGPPKDRWGLRDPSREMGSGWGEAPGEDAEVNMGWLCPTNLARGIHWRREGAEEREEEGARKGGQARQAD